MKDDYTQSGYETLSVDPLTEYRAMGIHLKHSQSGAEVYRVDAADDENLFGYAFCTPANDNTGVAHILEHTVLCGSERFPVKDPFMVLQKGSAHTFLNAMTYPDKTLYPASSTVKQDFLNLLRVYADAVFFPNLKPEAFRQEGHRLEFNDAGNLTRNGIVLNEMKGYFSTPEEIGNYGILKTLLPDTPYSLNSGGDPEFIPELTYEAFKKFHEAYYHPSNCRIFLYGNHDLDEVLSILDREFLSRFDRQPPAPPIPLQKHWKQPQKSAVYWATAENEDVRNKSSITLNWLWGDSIDPMKYLSSRTLSYILLGHSGSPLQKAILDSGLGEDISPLSGLTTDIKQMFFTVGLRGTEPEKELAFKKMITKTLETCTDGLNKDLIEGALRKIEFRAREIRGGYPFGLRLMTRSLRGWLHGGTPAESLAFENPMARLRKEMKNRGFENLIRRYLLENRHMSTVTIIPDPGLQQRRDAAERKELTEKLAGMSKEEKLEIQLDSQRLTAFRESPDNLEALASIPILAPSDLPREVQKITIESGKHGPVEWISHSTYSNGIVYLTMAFDLNDLAPELQPWMPLFSQSLTNVGIPGVSYDEMARELALITGGLGCRLEAATVLKNRGGGIALRLFISLKALVGQWESAIDSMFKLLVSSDFSDLKRIDDLLMEMRNDLKAAVVPSGDHFASLRAMTRHSESAAWEDMWEGVGQLFFLKDLGEQKNRALLASEALTRIRKSVINRKNLIVSVIADAPDIHLKKVLEMTELLSGNKSAVNSARMTHSAQTASPVSFAQMELVARSIANATPMSLSEQGFPATSEITGLFRHETTGECLTVPSAVSFSALSLPAVILGTAEHAHTVLLSHILSTGYLIENIRMKGGAYGTWSNINSLDGTFTFATFRDPLITPSIDVFRKSLDWVSTLDDKTIQTAIIGSVGQELKPLSPGQRCVIALRRYLYGITDSMRQVCRDGQLAATAADVVRAARSLATVWDKRSISVLADPAALDQACKDIPELAESQIELPV